MKKIKTLNTNNTKKLNKAFRKELTFYLEEDKQHSFMLMVML